MIILYLFQNVSRSELLVVIDKDVCSGNPLSVQFTSYSFTPTCIRNGEVQSVFRGILPETTSNDMS